MQPSEVKAVDKLGFTPLHCAVNGERFDELLVKRLLKEGANSCALTGAVEVWREANGILPCKEVRIWTSVGLRSKIIPLLYQRNIRTQIF